jgi:hypothetical protein
MSKTRIDASLLHESRCIERVESSQFVQDFVNETGWDILVIIDVSRNGDGQWKYTVEYSLVHLFVWTTLNKNFGATGSS